MDGQGTKCRINIAENYNRLSRVHERYRQTDRRQTDRQMDGRQQFTFAKNTSRATVRRATRQLATTHTVTPATLRPTRVVRQSRATLSQVWHRCKKPQHEKVTCSPRPPTLSQRHVDLHVWSHPNVVIYSKFHRNPFRGFGAPGGVEICPFPLLWLLAFTTACKVACKRLCGQKRRFLEPEQKSRPSSNVKVKGQGHCWQKNEKVLHFVRERSLGAQSSASSTPVGKSAHAV